MLYICYIYAIYICCVSNSSSPKTTQAPMYFLFFIHFFFYLSSPKTTQAPMQKGGEREKYVPASEVIISLSFLQFSLAVQQCKFSLAFQQCKFSLAVQQCKFSLAVQQRVYVPASEVIISLSFLSDSTFLFFFVYRVRKDKSLAQFSLVQCSVVLVQQCQFSSVGLVQFSVVQCQFSSVSLAVLVWFSSLAVLGLVQQFSSVSLVQKISSVSLVQQFSRVSLVWFSTYVQCKS